MVYHQLASEPHSSLSTASFLSSHQHGSVAKEFKLLKITGTRDRRNAELLSECEPSSGSPSSLSSALPCGAVRELKEAEERSA